MINFKANVATTNIEKNSYGDKTRFTKEDLKAMVDIPPQCRNIYNEFNSKDLIGRVDSIELEGDKVIAKGKIKRALGRGFIVTGGLLIKEDNRTMDVELFGFTKYPNDKTLTPIEYI